MVKYLTLGFLTNMYAVFYKAIVGVNGDTNYEFKLGDFGLAEIFGPGHMRRPLPPTLSSPHQNPKFSTENYDPEDDLYSVGQLMIELEKHLYDPGGHQDLDYKNLYSHLIYKTEH